MGVKTTHCCQSGLAKQKNIFSGLKQNTHYKNSIPVTKKSIFADIGAAAGAAAAGAAAGRISAYIRYD